MPNTKLTIKELVNLTAFPYSDDVTQFSFLNINEFNLEDFIRATIALDDSVKLYNSYFDLKLSIKYLLDKKLKRSFEPISNFSIERSVTVGDDRIHFHYGFSAEIPKRLTIGDLRNLSTEYKASKLQALDFVSISSEKYYSNILFNNTAIIIFE